MFASRIDIRIHLKFLYEVYTSFGFSSFIFNHNTKRVQFNKLRFRLTWLIFGYGCLYTTCLFSHVSYWTIAEWLRSGYKVGWQNQTAVEAQEDFILFSSFVSKYVRIFLLAVNHLTFGGVLTPAVNEMLKIYAALRQETDSPLFISSTFENILNIKLITCFVILVTCIPFYAYCIVTLNFFAVFGDVFVVVTLFGHLYSQMVFAISYTKMCEALEVATVPVDQRQLRKFLRLSFRINRVKGVLNKYFVALFLATYLNLFDDIANCYRDLTSWKHHREFEDYIPFVGQFKYLAGVSFDFYLMGYVSDLLIKAELLFAHQVMTLFSRCTRLERSQIQRDVDQLMVRSNIFDLHTRVYKIKVDRDFAFGFIMNIILAYVVTYLQFYISGTTGVDELSVNNTLTAYE